MESGVDRLNSTRCGQSRHMIQWRQFDLYRPLLLRAYDIRIGKIYADQDIIVSK